MSKVVKFYDTNALLTLSEKLFEDGQCFLLSSMSLAELEEIKTARNKDDAVKYQARVVTRLLDQYEDTGRYKVVVFNDGIQGELPDDVILEDCYTINRELQNDDADAWNSILVPLGLEKGDSLVFITDDLLCRLRAKEEYGLSVEGIASDESEEYTGFKQVVASDEELAYFYEHLSENTYELLANQYLIIRNFQNEVVDKVKWTGSTYKPLKRDKLKSQRFGVVKPYKDDVYQQLAIDSLLTNQVTMLKGPAGTGKSYLALGYLLYTLETQKIDQIVVFCNTVATMNAAKLGFLPGTRDEKLLDSQIGNMLAAKLGDIYIVEQMVRNGKLLLLPMSDIRGYDTSGRRAGVYITEAQNTDISLMKLALQRIGEDSICIIDGDYNAQVDMNGYAGIHNGMRRMSEVFRGLDFYGEVELQNIYRSRIAEAAERM